MKGADGAKLGGVASDGAMWSDWERMENQAQQGDARLRSGTKMAKGKGGNETAMKSKGRVCSGAQGIGFISPLLQNPPQPGRRLCASVSLRLASEFCFRISAKSQKCGSREGSKRSCLCCWGLLSAPA